MLSSLTIGSLARESGRLARKHRSAAQCEEYSEAMASGRRKVTVVGAGMVGGTAAQILALRDYADVVLVDIVEGLPQGKALIPRPASEYFGFAEDRSPSLGNAERSALQQALAFCGGNISSAARTLGISRATLHRKIAKYALNR